MKVLEPCTNTWSISKQLVAGTIRWSWIRIDFQLL